MLCCANEGCCKGWLSNGGAQKQERRTQSRGNRSGSGLFLFLFFLLWFFSLFHRGFEVADAFADPFADRRKLAGPEEQKGDRYRQQPMPERKLTHHSSFQAHSANPARSQPKSLRKF